MEKMAPVSTLVVEWIEIIYGNCDDMVVVVSTLVVEWIEMALILAFLSRREVSTLVVEWIEIWRCWDKESAWMGLHPRGGVD